MSNVSQNTQMLTLRVPNDLMDVIRASVTPDETRTEMIVRVLREALQPKRGGMFGE
jgi:hypothetical protein